MATPLTANFDGECRKPRHGSSGPGRAAWRINTEPPLSGVIDLGETTAPVAEFRGLLALLEALRGLAPSRIYISGDHSAVINVVNGEWQTWKPHLVALRDEARQHIKELEAVGWQINLVLIGSSANKAHWLLHPPKRPGPGRPRKVTADAPSA